MTGKFYEATDISAIISSRLKNQINKIIDDKHVVVFNLIGPPAIGKTFLQKYLFKDLKSLDPFHLPASAFLFDRKTRVDIGKGECSINVYKISKMNEAYQNAINKRKLHLLGYNHKTGVSSSTKRVITPTNLLYLEGPIWPQAIKDFKPDFAVLMKPLDFNEWSRAYNYRNINYRNYDLEASKKMFRLTKLEWIAFEKFINRTDLVNMTIDVRFDSSSMLPKFSIRSDNDEE